MDNGSRDIIYIGKPYIVDCDDNKVRLCADITDNGDTRTLYYEVDKEYGKYLVDDRADAFVVGLINNAMYVDKDIVSEVEITEQLLFQLNMYYIPVCARNLYNMNDVIIKCDTLPPIEDCANAVGTGNSGGVDSFYTMLKYSKEELKSFKLTHVIFNNISSGDVDEERIRNLFNKDIPERISAANELGLDFIAMYTNLYSLYKQPGIFNHYFALQYTSAAYALGKLFSVFYFSSTWPVADFSMDGKNIVSGGRFDIFSLDCVSNSKLKFYSAGTEVDRMEKMDYIMPNPIVQRHLQVCAIEQSLGGYEPSKKLNCGHCNKCGRTIAYLYAKNQLELYRDIINLEYFEKNKAKFLGANLAADQKGFVTQITELLIDANKYTFLTSVWRFLYGIRYKLAKNQTILNLYRKIRKK